MATSVPRGLRAAVLASLALLLASCAASNGAAQRACGGYRLEARALCGVGVVAPVVPPTGLLFSSFEAPLTPRFEATPVGSKQGRARVRYLQEPVFTGIPIVTWGEASIEAAAEEAGISQVHYVDYELLSVVGIFVELEVVVWGD